MRDDGDKIVLDGASRMKDFNQPELTGPSGYPMEIPDEMAESFRFNAMSQAEVNREMFDSMNDRLRQRIAEEIQKSRGLKEERGVILTRDGGIKERSVGGPKSVPASTKQLQDSVFFHNHPDGNAFSPEDLGALFTTGMEMVVAVGGGDLYGAKAGFRGTSPEVLADLMVRHSFLDDVAYAVVSDLVKNGQMGFNSAEKAHIHALLCQLAKEGFVDYSRISHGFGS